MADNENKLGQEILDDARRKAGQILDKAGREAAKLLAAARERQLALRAEKTAAAEKTAGEKIQTLRAVLEVEKRRQHLLSREEVIRAVLAKAAETVRDGAGIDRIRSLTELLREAASAVDSRDVLVRMRPDDIALLGEKTVVEIAAGAAGRVTVTPDPSLEGGAVVDTADGKRRFDNSPAARRQRLEKKLRPRIASELGL